MCRRPQGLAANIFSFIKFKTENNDGLESSSEIKNERAFENTKDGRSVISFKLNQTSTELTSHEASRSFDNSQSVVRPLLSFYRF
jgi:hypothetical protein